jgi:hypothetical protein
VKRLFAALLAVALISPMPVQAQACLDRETLTAARVHEFEAMMMAVNLRCKAIGVDISEGFEAMLATHAKVFAAADRRLRTYFSGGRRAYETYATQLGNHYGGGATDPANCQRFDKVARRLAGEPAIAGLGKVVITMIAQPRISGEICARP